MTAQNIIRTAQTANFTVLPNAIWNTGLSVAAISALGYLLSKPPTWRLRITDLRNKLGIGRDRVYRALNELVRAGYAKMIRLQRGVRWLFFDVPQLDETPDTAEPVPKSRLPEIQFTERPEVIERNEIPSLVSIEEQRQAAGSTIQNSASQEGLPLVVVPSEIEQPKSPALTVDPIISVEIDKLPLDPKEKRIAEKTLSNLSLDEVKAVLAVYAAALVKGGIGNKVGYLVGLVKASKNGSLSPVATNQSLTLSERIAKERQRKQEAEARGRVSNQEWAELMRRQYGITVPI